MQSQEYATIKVKGARGVWLETLVDLLNEKLQYQALGCYDQRNTDYEDIFNDS